jgi:ABC-2 type transport system permease protein
MLLTIARKEFREIVRDGRFRWAAAVVGGLLIVAGLAGWTAWRDQAQQRDTAQSTMQEMWFNQPAKNPHSAAHYGLWAFKPQMPLSFIDRGVDPYTGTASWLEAHRQNEFRFRPAMDATAAQRFGDWTAAGVLQLLLPLLIILLAHAAFAGERERGTLRQLASLGVPSRTLTMGKALGVGGALVLLLVPAAVVGAALVLWGAGAEGLLRLTAMSGLYLAYFALVLGITLFVSARAATARGALVVLLSLWAWNGLVAPRLAADMARAVAPTPTAREFAADVQRSLANGLDGHSPASARGRALQDSLLKAYNVASVDSLPFNFDGFAMQRGEEEANAVFDHHFGLLWEQYSAQDRAQLAGAIVAPLIAVRQLSMAIAGTDFAQHRAFATSAETYRRLLNKAMNDDIAEHAAAGEAFSYTADDDLWKAVGPFTYEAPGLGRVLLGQFPSLLFLGAWLAMLVVMVRGERRVAVH